MKIKNFPFQLSKKLAGELFGGCSGLHLAQAVTGQKQSQKVSTPSMAAGLELRARGIILLCLFTLRIPSFPQITPRLYNTDLLLREHVKRTEGREKL